MILAEIRRRGGRPLRVAIAGVAVLLVGVLPLAFTIAVTLLGLYLFAPREEPRLLSIGLMTVGPLAAMIVAACAILGAWASEWEARMADLPAASRWTIAIACWSWLLIAAAAWALWA